MPDEVHFMAFIAAMVTVPKNEIEHVLKLYRSQVATLEHDFQ